MSAAGSWIWQRVRGITLPSRNTGSAELHAKVTNALGRRLSENENVLETMDDLAERVIELRTILSGMEDKPRKVKVIFGDPEEVQPSSPYKPPGIYIGGGSNTHSTIPVTGPGPGAAGSMQQIGRVEKVKEDAQGIQVTMQVTDSDMIDALRMGRAELSIMNRLAQRRKG